MKTKKSSKLMYAGYAMPQAIMQVQIMVVSTFLMYYFTDVVGLTAASVTLMLFVARIWDSINDPIIGYIIDKKVPYGKNGKFKPLLIWGYALGLIFFGLTFTNFHLGDKGNLIYLYVIHIITSIFGTVSGIAYPTLAAAITSDPQKRTILATFKTYGGIFGGLIATVATVPLVKLIGKGNDQLGYTVVMWIYTAICFGLLLLTAKVLKEKKNEVVKNDNNDSEEKGSFIKGIINFFRTLKAIGSNKAFVLVAILSLFNLFATSVKTGIMLYYLKWVVGNEMIMGILSIASMMIMWVCAGFVPVITKKIGKKNAVIIATIINIVTTLIVAVFNGNSTVLIAMTGLTGISLALGNIAGFSMQIDTIDYNEWKTGDRSEGMLFAFLGLVVKFGTAVSPVFVGAILTITKYDANNVTDLAIKGINVGFIWLPIIFYLVALIATIFYPLTENRLKEIQEEVKARKASSIEY